jgi:nicotinamide-nucleotide amidase
MKRIVNKLIILMMEKKATLALAESVTCGLAAHKLSTVKGTSEVLRGSIVCYHEDVKKELLKVDKRLISKYSAESVQVTDSLVKNLKQLIKADVYAAITGLASAGGSETKNKPVGTIYYSIMMKNEIHRMKKVFRGTPLEIRKKACLELYKFIIKIITQ